LDLFHISREAIRPNHPFFGAIASFLFFAMLVLSPYRTSGQACYILETRDAGTGTEAFHFLLVRNDGSAEIRSTSRAGNGIVSLFRSDLSDTSMAYARERYLSPVGAPVVMRGEMADHVPVRVKMELVRKGIDYFFRPAGMERLRDSAWLTIDTFRVSELSLNELAGQLDLVRKFFSETDPFYVFLNDRRSRGPFQARNSKLFLVIVANTLAHDGGESSKKDMQNVMGLLTSFAEDTRIVMRSLVISDKEFRKNRVTGMLDTLKTGPEDILVFYYTGHGFRYTDDTSRFPRLTMRYDSTLDYRTNNLRLEQDIHAKLSSMRCRVKLIIADCCNTDIGVKAPVGGLPFQATLRASRAFSTMLNRKNAEQLFFPSAPLTMLISSSGLDQKASGNPELGGFFTSSFLDELKNALYGPIQGLNWDYIFAQARKKATWLALSADCDDSPKVERCTQTPFARFIR